MTQKGILVRNEETGQYETIMVDLSPEEEADYQARLIPPALELPVRLLNLLNDSAKTISTDIANGAPAPPAGTFAQIASISTSLQELARLVPVSIYATEALAAVTNLGTLPDPLEAVRQAILTEINNEINGANG